MGIFNRFVHQTPESVELEFTLAGIGNRAYAFLIDTFCLFGIQVIFLLILIIFPNWIASLIEDWGLGRDNIRLWVIAIVLLLFFCLYAGYFVLFETLWQGQTPGKRVAKIRVICDDGRPIHLQQASLRALLRPIDDLLSIGVLMIALGRQEKRLGDWVAGTLVIQEESVITSSQISISGDRHQLTAYILDIGDISRLHPEDFATLRNYLRRRRDLLPQARRKVALQLAHQVKDLLLLDEIPDQTGADEFLEAVYLAYQQHVDLTGDR